MRDDIDISVIVPIYNTAKYLNKCLKSILNQIFKNIEIILIDDGSTDNSLDICNYYKSNYKNVSIYSQKNSGPSVARNFGLKKAKGKYVSFVDSDDYIDLDMYSHMMNANDSRNVDVIISSYVVVDLDNEKVIRKKEYKNNYELIFKDDDKIKRYLLNKISLSPCDKLFRREFLIENNINFLENVYYEDINMILKCMYYSKEISITNNAFYNYTQRQNSITHTTTLKHLNDFKSEIRKCYEFINRHYNFSEIEVYIRSLKFLHTSMLLKMLKNLSKEKEVEEYFKKLPKHMIIFGASSAGELIKYFCDLFNIKVQYYSDNDSCKWGQYFNDTLVLNPDDLKKTKGVSKIFIASMYYIDIYEQLTKLGFKNEIVDLEIF